MKTYPVYNAQGRVVRVTVPGAEEPTPALVADAFYLGDNGRLTCGRLRCAGATAHFTGRDLSGQPLHRLSMADLAEMARQIGHRVDCEGCVTERRAAAERG